VQKVIIGYNKLPLIHPNNIPTASDAQKLQHIQQDNSFDKNLLFKYSKSSKFLISDISVLKNNLARVIFKGEINHKSRKLHTENKPKKYKIMSLSMIVIGLYTCFLWFFQHMLNICLIFLMYLTRWYSSVYASHSLEFPEDTVS